MIVKYGKHSFLLYLGHVELPSTLIALSYDQFLSVYELLNILEL